MAHWYLDENIHLASLSEILDRSHDSLVIYVVDRNWIKNHVYGDMDSFIKEKHTTWVSGIFWVGNCEHHPLLYVTNNYNPLKDVIDYYRNYDSPKTTEISNLDVGFL
jgi:hypothetical protein